MRRFSGGSTDSAEEITSPSTSMVPLVGAMKPAIMRRVVVLPQPDGPSSETSSPSSSARLKSSTAVTPPNTRDTWRSTRRLMFAPSRRSCRGPPEHEVAPEQPEADEDQDDGDDDEHES